MTVAHIDHVTIRCEPAILPAMLGFYEDVVGLRQGPRPPFDFPGHWLYSSGEPCLHLAGICAAESAAVQRRHDGVPRGGTAAPSGVDHFAFRLRGLDRTREALRNAGLRFAEVPVPATHLWQIFVGDPSGAKLELGFDLLAEAALTPVPVSHVDANGTRIALTRSGNGPPLLLIHGAEADHTMFDALARALAEHCTVIAYDQRDSGRTINRQAPYSLVDLADDAAGLIRAMGFDHVHVYGTSLGGQIAQLLAARDPGLVDRLVLGSTWRVGLKLAEIAPQTAAALAELRADPAGNAGRIASYFFPDLSLQLNPGFAAMFAGSPRSPEQRARRAALFASPPRIDLGAVRAPTLVMTGAIDRLVPNAASIALADEISGSSVAALPGVGHVAALQAPVDAAREIVRFLGQ
jgi:3-oxoadipate enol-lactonase